MHFVVLACKTLLFSQWQSLGWMARSRVSTSVCYLSLRNLDSIVQIDPAPVETHIAGVARPATHDLAVLDAQKAGDTMPSQELPHCPIRLMRRLSPIGRPGQRRIETKRKKRKPKEEQANPECRGQSPKAGQPEGHTEELSAQPCPGLLPGWFGEGRTGELQERKSIGKGPGRSAAAPAARQVQPARDGQSSRNVPCSGPRPVERTAAMALAEPQTRCMPPASFAQ